MAGKNKMDSLSVENFREEYPNADEKGITSLFKFYNFNFEKAKYLFIDQKLYHPIPSQFNDPFECKPYFRIRKNSDVRSHIVKILVEKGLSKKSAKKKFNELPKPELHEIARQVMLGEFGKIRICSFTHEKDNLLLWSHYADSHKGFCVEFDATKKPINTARKVNYEKKYPETYYPCSLDETLFIPALTKSEDWRYEKEYRSIFIPEAKDRLPGDDESLSLNGDEIKNVYLGAMMNENESEKRQIIDLIKQSDFNPGILIKKLSKSDFKLEENPCL